MTHSKTKACIEALQPALAARDAAKGTDQWDDAINRIEDTKSSLRVLRLNGMGDKHINEALKTLEGI